jgi:hypothetical protein
MQLTREPKGSRGLHRGPGQEGSGREPVATAVGSPSELPREASGVVLERFAYPGREVQYRLGVRFGGKQQPMLYCFDLPLNRVAHPYSHWRELRRRRALGNARFYARSKQLGC